MVQNQSVVSHEENKYAWVILVVVYFAGVVAPFNQFKVPPIMPLLMARFHLDLTQAGLLMSQSANGFSSFIQMMSSNFFFSI